MYLFGIPRILVKARTNRAISVLCDGFCPDVRPVLCFKRRRRSSLNAIFATANLYVASSVFVFGCFALLLIILRTILRFTP